MRLENGRGLAAVFFLAQKKCLEKERYLSQTYISRHLEIGSSVNKALLSPRKDRAMIMREIIRSPAPSPQFMDSGPHVSVLARVALENSWFKADSRKNR